MLFSLHFLIWLSNSDVFGLCICWWLWRQARWFYVFLTSLVEIVKKDTIDISRLVLVPIVYLDIFAAGITQRQLCSRQHSQYKDTGMFHIPRGLFNPLLWPADSCVWFFCVFCYAIVFVFGSTDKKSFKGEARITLYSGCID